MGSEMCIRDSFDSVDMESAWFASRYDRGTPDYINCPMTEEEYQHFWEALVTAQEAEVHGFEDKNVFEGCMPVEVMARRGKQTLCYGPLKPRGLNDPKTGKEPFAVVQLRQRGHPLQSGPAEQKALHLIVISEALVAPGGIQDPVPDVDQIQQTAELLLAQFQVHSVASFPRTEVGFSHHFIL